jgi:hypothetical protein
MGRNSGHGHKHMAAEQPKPTKKGKQPNYKRVVDREQGQTLVFAGAQDAARQQGKIPDGVFASFEKSSINARNYTLKTAEGKLIARIPLTEAREMMRFRRAVARKALGKVKVEFMKESTASVERRQLRVQDESIRALAWAIGAGRRFPIPRDEERKMMVLVGLLLCCVLPGVVYYFIDVRKSRAQYKQDLDQLVMRWRTLGKPDPPDSFFALYDL